MVQDGAGWLLGETRERVLVLLRRAGRASIQDLADALGVTDNAVRTHVAALERDGLVEAAGTRRDTGGKPARLYAVSARGEELFPKAYALVLNALLRELEASEGRERVVGLLRRVGAAAGAALDASPARAPAAGEGAGREGGPAAGMDEVVEARVHAAVAALRALGGDVEVERRVGGWRLHGHGCPLSAVVTEHAAACALAQALLAEVSGLRVRERCQRAGRPRCMFELGAASSRDPGAVRGG